MKKNNETLIAFGLFFVFMIGIFLFVYLTYRSEKSMIYQQIDKRLYAIAKSQILLLAPDFHDRATAPSSISEAEDLQNIDRLSNFAKFAHLSYVYSLIEYNGNIYFTASSATDEERATGHNMTRYFDLYEDVPSPIKSAIHEKHLIYDESSDKWGTFRSIIIPLVSPRGKPYAVGADIPVGAINEMLKIQAAQYFTYAFILFLLSFFSLLWRLKHIKKLAYYDPLTSLPNRMELANRVNYAITSSQRSHDTFAILFLDLDHFKEINDTLGHNVGDELLIEVSKRIKSVLRKSDTASRMGGDEFVLLLPFTDAISIPHIAQNLLEVIAQPYHIRDNELTVTASIGIALYPLDGRDLQTLSKNADSAMYSAKKEGRQCYQFFTNALQECAKRHMQLLNALHHALERKELDVHYQPQISLHDGHIIGAEALLRWNHPEFGSVSPVEFIPIAEESGLIWAIGEWVLRRAIEDSKRWQANLQPTFLIAVNVSAVQFRHANFPALVTKILEKTNFSPECLEIELTEGVAMHDPQAVINIMKKLHKRGIKIAIDDFGTGYSSLSYLKKFNITKLKIDKSFVNDITTDPDDKAIVGAIIHMAHTLGIKVIAEGVETHEQLQYLGEQRCDEVQGYYYSKPLSTHDFELFIKAHTKGIEFQADAMHHA